MKLTKEECRDKILSLAKQTEGSITIEFLKENKLYYEMLKHWDNLTDFKNEFGLIKKQTYEGKTYSKEELIKLLQNFYKETGIVPNSLFMEKHSKEYGLPSRKTFTNKIGGNSWKDILLICGLDPKKTKTFSMREKQPHDNKEFLTNLIHEFIDENNKVPTFKEISEYYGISLKDCIRRHFGTWNGCLTELGLSLNSVTQYTDEELDNAFLGFVKEFG